MHKYKYFLMLFSGIVLLLILCCFPISFDNNDDQAMYFINAGILSGIPSPNIAHTNFIIGILLKFLFSFINQINWYVVYLQFVQCIALLTIYLLMIYNSRINLFLSCLLLSFLIFGFSALCIVKVQYTIVALLCCAAALLCIQSELSKKGKYLLALFFVTGAILIRKDTFYIFFVFNTPLLFLKFVRNEIDKQYFLMLAVSVILFCGLNFINNNNAEYQKTQMYTYFKALDDVGDKPVIYTTTDLMSFGFTEDDMTLIKARYPAREIYASSDNIIRLSKKIRSKRTMPEMIIEIKKFISDERYMILIYVLSILTVLIYSRKSYLILLLNGLIFLFLIMYLATTIRIPHRVTFPLLIYVSLANLYLLSRENIKYKTKLILLSVFALLGFYKFYCTCKLINMHKENHVTFDACQNEINMHPNYLFISLHDGLPIEFMDAWQPPENLFPANNLIMTGWNVWAPDFQNVLNRHQLKNISSDLKNKQNVFFLTDSEAYQKAFINVMKERYNLICHFENTQVDFIVLHPKKLVFDN